MKATDVRAKSTDELKDEILVLKKQQFNARFQQATGQLENTAQMKKARRHIARIKTILGQRAQAGS